MRRNKDEQSNRHHHHLIREIPAVIDDGWRGGGEQNSCDAVMTRAETIISRLLYIHTSSHRLLSNSGHATSRRLKASGVDSMVFRAEFK